MSDKLQLAMNNENIPREYEPTKCESFDSHWLIVVGDALESDIFLIFFDIYLIIF